eukprot:Skav234933  [mRNA]  locus=scaffold2677:104695:113641:+ [translate_table: standard]
MVCQARHDVDTAADLRYEAIPGVMQRIRDLEKRKRQYEESTESPLLVETVTPVHIAEVVARWTGIPVSKLTQGEKAFPGYNEVLNVLLQLLDDGRITDSQGRTVDCSCWAAAGWLGWLGNCVVILTSNLGSEHLMRVLGTGAPCSERRARVSMALGT